MTRVFVLRRGMTQDRRGMTRGPVVLWPSLEEKWPRSGMTPFKIDAFLKKRWHLQSACIFRWHQWLDWQLSGQCKMTKRLMYAYLKVVWTKIVHRTQRLWPLQFATMSCIFCGISLDNGEWCWRYCMLQTNCSYFPNKTSKKMHYMWKFMKLGWHIF